VTLISGGKNTGKYVTEHVTELQTPAQFAQSMIDNKYPDKSIPQGISSGYSWEDGGSISRYAHMPDAYVNAVQSLVTPGTCTGRGKILELHVLLA
jgi:hypothetical protein